MKILDLYAKLETASQSAGAGYAVYENDPELKPVAQLARSWQMDLGSARRWLATPEAKARAEIARQYRAEAPGVVARVEAAFGRELPGLLILAPSYGEFDGFARYELGSHTVLLGIDYPDADLDYLKALTAHELSHVYRDHSPDVWRHLGKPLSAITRREYLDATEAPEHLVSEGLATLFSQAIYPEIPPVVHHYYDEPEWRWVEENSDSIHRSLIECLQGDADVWSYYSDSRVAPGSPSRTQYYWAAKMIAARLREAPDPLRELVRLHGRPAAEFTEFAPKPP
jgi:hypothetical protein